MVALFLSLTLFVLAQSEKPTQVEPKVACSTQSQKTPSYELSYRPWGNSGLGEAMERSYPVFRASESTK